MPGDSGEAMSQNGVRPAQAVRLEQEPSTEDAIARIERVADALRRLSSSGTTGTAAPNRIS